MLSNILGYNCSGNMYFIFIKYCIVYYYVKHKLLLLLLMLLLLLLPIIRSLRQSYPERPPVASALGSRDQNREVDSPHAPRPPSGYSYPERPPVASASGSRDQIREVDSLHDPRRCASEVSPHLECPRRTVGGGDVGARRHQQSPRCATRLT